MSRGYVKWFNETKGYGFIKQEEGEDIFVHFTSLKDKNLKTLNKGDEVEFEVKASPRGLKAVNVVKRA